MVAGAGPQASEGVAAKSEASAARADQDCGEAEKGLAEVTNYYSFWNNASSAQIATRVDRAVSSPWVANRSSMGGLSEQLEIAARTNAGKYTAIASDRSRNIVRFLIFIDENK